MTHQEKAALHIFWADHRNIVKHLKESENSSEAMGSQQKEDRVYIPAQYKAQNGGLSSNLLPSGGPGKKLKSQLTISWGQNNPELASYFERFSRVLTSLVSLELGYGHNNCYASICAR